MGVLGALQNGSPVRPSDEGCKIMGTKRTFCRPWRQDSVSGGDGGGSISLNSKRLLLSSPIVYPAPGLLTQ